MIKIYDVTIRVVVDADGLVSILPIRTRELKIPEPKPEEFDEKESDEK